MSKKENKRSKQEENITQEETGCLWCDKKHHLWFPISFTKYSVEDGRLYINSGVFSSREDECLLYRILDISMSRTFFQRIFGTGTIELNTKDRSTPIIYLENISHPSEVKRMLSRLIEEDRRKKSVEGKDMYGASNHFDPVEGHMPDEDPFMDSDFDMHIH